MTTLATFIEKHSITMTANPTDSNPNMNDSDNMNHWIVTLRRPRPSATHATMNVPFSMGAGFNGNPPDLTDVLDCLASDNTAIENTDGFEDWASEYDLNADSRKVERTYHTAEDQARQLARFLSSAAYAELLWETERL